MDLEKFKTEVLSSRRELLGYARSFIADGDEAEDVVQEVVIRLWNIRDTLDAHPSIPALLRTATRNLCLNRLRQLRRSASLDRMPGVPSGEMSAAVCLDLKDRVDCVLKIMEGLPPVQKAIFRMRHVDGYEVAEIAEITGCSAESVRMNLSRARKKLRTVFDKLETR